MNDVEFELDSFLMEDALKPTCIVDALYDRYEPIEDYPDYENLYGLPA